MCDPTSKPIILTSSKLGKLHYEHFQSRLNPADKGTRISDIQGWGALRRLVFDPKKILRHNSHFHQNIFKRGSYFKKTAKINK